jgi:hypothetical protein
VNCLNCELIDGELLNCELLDRGVDPIDLGSACDVTCSSPRSPFQGSSPSGSSPFEQFAVESVRR